MFAVCFEEISQNSHKKDTVVKESNVQGTVTSLQKGTFTTHNFYRLPPLMKLHDIHLICFMFYFSFRNFFGGLNYGVYI